MGTVLDEVSGWRGVDVVFVDEAAEAAAVCSGDPRAEELVDELVILGTEGGADGKELVMAGHIESPSLDQS